MSDLPKELLYRLREVKGRRARIVIDHILKHGHITTEEISTKYGYDHPPRAARDVREQGIPLETFSVTGSHGRKISAYRFGDLSKIKRGKLGGRITWPKGFKKELVARHDSKCCVCLTTYEERYLQIDHRVPYEVAGDVTDNPALDEFMLVCGSCNRAKSWSCEHCQNWTKDQLTEVCRSCYWASPENYDHIALRLVRRLDIVWSDNQILDYDRLVSASNHTNMELPDFVKDVIKRSLQ